MWGGAGYAGIGKRGEHKDRDVEWFEGCRPGKLRPLEKQNPRRQLATKKRTSGRKLSIRFYGLKKYFVTARFSTAG
ncbi:hypothetical protein TERTU_2691 [Teredinibacter turnerae T7901]|uniref:Uncharacterized protein n=1 Tax=Teredinibacter turnerae (strain ATCC 39867 / T7901) TaxID=377629 RepID=C5BM11_TERTT|nr:hypothetical protein TERTU_2691 [Teredinibacter turnerae T7901]